MSIGFVDPHPSVIEDKIYSILESDPKFTVSSEEWSTQAIDAVINYLNTYSGEWSSIDDPYPNLEGGSISICWIEDGHLYHIVLNYIN